MNSSGLSLLGRMAAALRRVGLQPLLAVVRDGMDSVFRALNYPPLAAECGGVRLHGFLRHRSFLEEIARGAYEPVTRNILLSAAASADYFIDAGAHIGLYSLLAGRGGSASPQVLAFEPDPYNCRALRWNLNRNRRRADVHQAAVSESDGSARMLISDGTIGSSLNLGRTRIGGTHLLDVPTVALDSLLQTVDSIESKAFLLKLDVEGAEIRALNGLQSTLRRADRIALICEANPEAMEADGKTTADLVSVLRGAGLQVFAISEAGGGLVPADGSSYFKGNLLAVRNWKVDKDWFCA
jgi:FkbM family methyltransferase